MTKQQIRHAFWEAHPSLPRRKITSYDGNGKMHCTDVRCAFVAFIDILAIDGKISQEMAQKITL